MPPLLDKEGSGVVSNESTFSYEHFDSGEVPLWSPLAGGRAIVVSEIRISRNGPLHD